MLSVIISYIIIFRLFCWKIGQLRVLECVIKYIFIQYVTLFVNVHYNVCILKTNIYYLDILCS